MASPAENMFRFLGGIGGGDNGMTRLADSMTDPLRAEELRMRREERARQIEQQKRTQELLQNPQVLGRLATQFNLPPEIISGVSSFDELATLGRLTQPESMGATGAIVKQLMAENPDISFSDALAQVQTGYRQGVQFQGGQATPIQGLGQALGNIGGEEKYGTEMGGLKAQAEMKPQIEAATQQAQEVGKERGTAQAKLESMSANMPKVEKFVADLRDLAEKATYTKGGQLVDTIMRETGQTPRESAVAREKFTAKINNEVLPLLRETFGAAFTVQEGESLRATLGDVNKSPAEKQAALDAFIEAKTGEIGSLERRMGVQSEKTAVRRYNPATGKIE